MPVPDSGAGLEGDPLEGWTIHGLVGPTAAGKSALALAVAEIAGAEILSLDSMQVYRGMDVGTAKPSRSERERVRHHLIDVVDPPERYDVTRYQADLRSAVRDVRARGARALFVGGTGFYLAALLRGIFEGPPADLALRGRIEERARALGNESLHAELARADPRSAARIHVNDTKRLVRALEVIEQTGRTLSDWQREPGWGGHDGAGDARSVRASERSARESERSARLVGLALDAGDLDRRIAERTRAMIDQGWAEEALAVRAGPGFGPTSSQALGYREVLDLADGRIARAECEERIVLRTRQLARRQRTWYRGLGGIRWLPAPPSHDLGATSREVVELLGWA